jgi:hypothetical protein
VFLVINSRNFFMSKNQSNFVKSKIEVQYSNPKTTKKEQQGFLLNLFKFLSKIDIKKQL